MKRLLSLLMSFVMLFVPLTAFAQSNNENIVTDDYNSGYMVEKSSTSNTLSSKTVIKNYYFYTSDNILQWSATVKATFTYNANHVDCENMSASYSVCNPSWKCTSYDVIHSGDSVTGVFTFKKYVWGVPINTVSQSLEVTGLEPYSE